MPWSPGVVLGLVLALMKMSRIKVLTALASLYIEIIRGTPLIVQALIMAYGLPQLLQSSGISFRWPYLIIPAVIVCGLNSAAYVAEVIRSGIQAVDKGQMEAARSLGFHHKQAMMLVILPQAVRNILPALGNEFVTIIKESSIVSVIGIADPDVPHQGRDRQDLQQLGMLGDCRTDLLCPHLCGWSADCADGKEDGSWQEIT